MNWNYLTIAAQVSCTAWFFLTHWVPLPPLNDLKEEAFSNERATNLVLHFFQAASIAGFIFHINWLMWLGALFWTISFAGHLISWWLPYFLGWPKAFLKNAEVDNAKTYHFLPPRKNHPIPDLNHCIIGLLVLFAMITSLMALQLHK
jgi:hypothetical protein